ncbi:uncharacterized protein H6S33_007556 [Morchella sextelata]|uniref:uncharacterized protein n=1 Tax=Morchella sextelata TaxID=1174677 RepID=UPI001D03AE67|nr:uncharacterized protein H6S33_007556 [Morchella sextelata]KAH0603897.1 hypothetical protein H6S33_007556 [Morchella sextelata]
MPEIARYKTQPAEETSQPIFRTTLLKISIIHQSWLMIIIPIPKFLPQGTCSLFSANPPTRRTVPHPASHLARILYNQLTERAFQEPLSKASGLETRIPSHIKLHPSHRFQIRT